MTRGDDRDAYIRDLRAEGWTAVEIGAEVGLSRSQVHRILAVVGDPARGDLDDAEDPWTDHGDETELALFDAEDEVYPPPPPWTFVGYDRDEERWITDDGKPVDALARYRWRMYQIHDHDDRAGVERVDADMDRQRAAWR